MGSPGLLDLMDAAPTLTANERGAIHNYRAAKRLYLRARQNGADAIAFTQARAMRSELNLLVDGQTPERAAVLTKLARSWVAIDWLVELQAAVEQRPAGAA